MLISVRNLSKRYSSDWIFKDLSFDFESDKTYAISGSNGSGKSTLLQILSGKLPTTQGEINFSINSKVIKEEDLFRSITMCAPYIELIEEFNLQEMVNFHFHLNKIAAGVNQNELIRILDFDKQKSKRISDFSSGMKQKLKLALAIYTKKACLILDEPSSNLDEKTKVWYKKILKENKLSRVVIIASNEESDFIEGSIKLNIEDYK